MREDGTKKLKSKGVYFISPDTDTFLSKKVCVQKLKIKSKEIPVYHEGFLLGKAEDLQFF